MMQIAECVHKFITQSLPIWELRSTFALVRCKWHRLQAFGHSPEGYSTARMLHKDPNLSLPKRFSLSKDDNGECVFVEAPDDLQNFYKENGLVQHQITQWPDDEVKAKLSAALQTIAQVPQAANSIGQLVKAIQVVDAGHPDFDMSYSHPDLPFTVFVSLCEGASTQSNLRVAEGILHEAMHLKLTLVEEVLSLVNTQSSAVYFSPWRDEMRPAQGVLHGLFVFRAIHDFYQLLFPITNDASAKDFLSFRIEQIHDEICSLNSFANCPDLTPAGATLTENLLPLN